MQTAGWNTEENLSPFKPLSDDEVISLINSALLGNAKRTTSYKFVFFKSILDNVFNVKFDCDGKEECFLSFDDISMRFSEIYWNLILKFHLRQMPLNADGKISAIERELVDFCKKYKFPQNQIEFPFESLRAELQIELSEKIKKSVVTKYVVGAFCSDTQWQFYHFSKPKKWNGIYLNKDFFTVLAKYRSDFEKVNYFEWIKYLEGINREEDSYMLAGKLDRSTERENLDRYRTALFDFGQSKCFYCGRNLLQNAVDHFVPWSFVKDDKLWNFVLSCPACNSKKSDSLTSQKFLSNIRVRNESLQKVNSVFVQNEFSSYSFSKLALMYQNAAFNGFKTGWEPR